MTTETTSRKQSTIGKAAYTAAAKKGFEPFKIGSLFEHEGCLYRVTNNAVGGLQSYFSHERVPTISFYLSEGARASLSGLPAAVEEALGRIRAVAPEPARPTPSSPAAPAPFGFPLDGLPVCRGCPECNLLSDIAEPKSVGPEAELDEAKARIAYLESVEAVLRKRVDEVHKILDAKGYKDTGDGLPGRVEHALNTECARANNAEALHKSRDYQAKQSFDRAMEFERQLASIKDIVDKADILPF